MSSWAFIVLELKNVRNAANKKIFFNVKNVKNVKLKRVNRFSDGY
jgi:hypothetical protein